MSIPIRNLFDDDQPEDTATEISVRSQATGEATIVSREGGDLVFSSEVPLRCSEMKPTKFALGKRWTWPRRSIRIDPDTRRKYRSLKKKISQRRANKHTDLHLAAEIEELHRLEGQIAKVPIEASRAVLTLAPHGQYWLHVATVRKGGQKGADYVDNWLDDRKSKIQLRDSSDVMRYFEQLYPDSEHRFGPTFSFSPFETDSTIMDTGFPDVLWPSDFFPIDGAAQKPKGREEPESHLCIGLLAEPIRECVKEIASSESIENKINEIINGMCRGKHRKDKEDYLEPELFDQNLLDEYVWCASMKALAGPPNEMYYKVRGNKKRSWNRVDDYAAHILAKMVFSTDRRLWRKGTQTEDMASASLADGLATDESAAWMSVRRHLRTPQLDQNTEEIFRQLSAELVALVRSAGRRELVARRSAIWRLLRMVVRHDRYDMAEILVEQIEKLILEDPNDGEFERMLIYYSWRVHTR